MEMKKNHQLEYPWNFIDAVLKEPLSWQQLVGGLLILGFTLLNELDT